MQNYFPIEHTRTIFYDQKKTKNHPRACIKGHHNFCSIDYEWVDDISHLDHMNKPINQALLGVVLPDAQEKEEPIKYDNMTEEGLDDWVAQSMNRTLNSILNPNKKYFLPPTLDEQLKVRYRRQYKSLKVQKDDTYFKTKRSITPKRSYLSHKKRNTIDFSELCFDHNRLQLKKNLGSLPIKVRQNKNEVSKTTKLDIKRRNAILLDNDIHYHRLLADINLQRQPDTRFNIEQENKLIQSLNRNKLFTLNYESLRRRSNQNNAPNSIIQYPGIDLKQQTKTYNLAKGFQDEIIKQEEQQQAYRLKGNAQAERAYSIMENFSQTSSLRRSSKKKSHFSYALSNEKKVSDLPDPKKNTFFQTFDASFSQPKKSLVKQPAEKKPLIPTRLNLGKKVLKLLQNMQVSSQKINLQMIRFQLHIEYLELKGVEKDNLSHKWIKKGLQELQKLNLSVAFDCFKQSLIQSPQYFNSVYNICAILERQHRFTQCLQWLKVAKQFNTDKELVMFAISLVHFKKQEFQQSLEQINQLIMWLTNEKKLVPPKYLYLRALCYKKFYQYQKANNDYKLVLQSTKSVDESDLATIIFSHLFAKKRRYMMKVDPLSYIRFRQTCYLILYENGSVLRQDGLVRTQIQKTSEIQNKLQGKPFFKRFSPQLIQKLLAIAIYEYIESGQLIFIHPDQCMIIISGIVLIKNHQKNILLPQTVALLKQGDFVGANKIDAYMNWNLNNWYLARTNVQLLRIKSLEFQSLWRGQLTFQIDYKYNFLKNTQLFKNLSDATLLKLCELMSKKTYKAGEVLYDDLSYIPSKQLNKKGVGFSLTQSSSRINSTLEEKFNEIYFPGLFVIISGQIAIRDFDGFSNNNILTERDFFGQNLVINVDGFHNYGRLQVQSQTAELYVLELENIIWCFSLQDKDVMIKNCENFEGRKSLELIKGLRQRYYQKKQIEKAYRIE